MEKYKNEKKIVKRFLRDRSNENFVIIYEFYANSLMRSAVYLCGHNKKVAEDIFQNTWITALEKLHNFKFKSSLKTWLTGILFNKYREYLKTSIKDTNLIASNELSFNESRLTALEIDIKKAVFQLPAGYSQVLTLHDIEGFKHKEIAEILNISLGTSKSQLFHARKKMRQILSEYKN